MLEDRSPQQDVRHRHHHQCQAPNVLTFHGGRLNLNPCLQELSDENSVWVCTEACLLVIQMDSSSRAGKMSRSELDFPNEVVQRIRLT